MTLEFKPAVRKSVPMLISVASVSGGGKTYSSLLLAAGIAGPKGKVGMIDTENGRGALYCDSPGIMRALPNGYVISQMDPPFSPQRYIEAIESAEKAGINVLVIDSTSHEWEGIDGCCEIAEKFKRGGMPNWAKAKMEHKRFLNHCLSTNMHIIFCLRARDKVKIVKVNGKDEIIPIGLQPICEKNFVFEQLVSLQLDEQTHFANPIKVPEMLSSVFPGGRLISKEDGERIRLWNDGAAIGIDPAEQLSKRARAAAEKGTQSYRDFFGSLTAAQKKTIQADHEENKLIAETAELQPEQSDAAEPEAISA